MFPLASFLAKSFCKAAPLEYRLKNKDGTILHRMNIILIVFSVGVMTDLYNISFCYFIHTKIFFNATWIL